MLLEAWWHSASRLPGKGNRNQKTFRDAKLIVAQVTRNTLSDGPKDRAEPQKSILNQLVMLLRALPICWWRAAPPPTTAVATISAALS